MKLLLTITIIILGLMTNSCKNSTETNLSKTKIAQIEEEIIKTAYNHLNSKSAESALSYYTKDATFISNGIQYTSFESFASMLKEFYSTLSKIKLATYDDILINVITDKVVLFNARFRWSSIDINGIRFDLEGTNSVLYERKNDQWKIKFRHESFNPIDN